MAMTQSALLFIGVLAALIGYFGLFRQFSDDWTPVLLTFISAILWGVMGLSSFDVIVRSTSYATASEPIMPLVFVGIGMAFVTALFGFAELLSGLGNSVSNEVKLG